MNDAALAELLRVARYAEIESGLIPPWSRRPLLAVERRAHVDYPAIAAAYLSTYGVADRILSTFESAIIADLRAALPVDGDPREVSTAATRWSLRLTTGAARARLAAVTALSSALDELAVTSSALMRREIDRQGFTGGAALLADRRRNPIGRFEDDAGLAVEVAATKLQQALLGAGQAADRDGTLQAVASAGHVAALDSARQAAHIAHGEGRADVAEEMPEPVEIVASELLDENTCGPCSRIDGRQYSSLAAGEVDYPSEGPYRNCLGGARCRGMLVIVYA